MSERRRHTRYMVPLRHATPPRRVSRLLRHITLFYRFSLLLFRGLR